MTGFVLASVVMALLALLLLLRPWWQGQAASGRAALEQQMAQLDALREAGTLTAAAHSQAHAALAQQLAATPAPAAGGGAEGTALRRMALAGALLLAVVGGGGYAWLGSPAALTGEAARAAQAGGEGAHEVSPEQITAMLAELEARLQARPDDIEGWTMLARSYAVTSQFDKAVPAYRRALALQPGDPTLLADLADALAMAQGRELAGEPLQLLQQALKADPRHLKALSLAGAEAYNRRDFKAALAYWERLRDAAPADSVFLKQVLEGIEEARVLAAGGQGAASPLPAPADRATSAPAPVAAAPVLAGVVRLAPALAARAAPEDTLFVFARAAEGSRMPLSISRHQVKDLPLRFSLDDSQAMSSAGAAARPPAGRLSEQAQLVVVARISRSGQATPQPGDLQGQTAAIAPGRHDLEVVIDQAIER